MEIVWKRKSATPAGTNPVTAASLIAGSQQTAFQESGNTISQQKGKVKEGKYQKANTVLASAEKGLPNQENITPIYISPKVGGGR